MMIGTDYIGRCKSNYDTVTALTVPLFFMFTLQIAQ